MQPNFQDTLNRILLDYTKKKIDEKSSNDDMLLSTSTKESKKEKLQYEHRDLMYTSLLQEYIRVYTKKSSCNKKYKLAFFIIAMSAFSLIITVSLISLVIVATKIDSANILSSALVAISSASGIISSIVVLPKIIAKHLFPTDEDKNMIDMVKNMQDNDSGIRDYLKNITDKS